VVLGVSQTVLENEYYMVDLVRTLEAKRKHDAAGRLNDVLMILATNNRGMDDAEYKKFIGGLNKELGIKAENKFNRDKFEQLRAMTEMGGNRAR
jgi:hypothetical protein